MPHTALRVVHVALEARNYRDMEMWDGLAGGRAGIETHIEAVRVQLLVKLPSNHVDEIEDCGLFGSRRREPVGNSSQPRMPCFAAGLLSRIAAARLGCSPSTAQHRASNRRGMASFWSPPSAFKAT